MGTGGERKGNKTLKILFIKREGIWTPAQRGKIVKIVLFNLVGIYNGDFNYS